MAQLKCIECGRELNRCISREQGPSGPERRMQWCPNPQCGRYGEMIEETAAAEEPQSGKSQQVAGQ